MRDRLTSGRFNPTQAGNNETLGTPSVILDTGDSLVIQSRQCALWHGDGGYDYIRWENIGADPYQNDNGNSDIDGIDEENLEGKQLTEVGSEFDYYGLYEIITGRDSITIPCFRHYYEYRFIRAPGHCMSQFGPGTEAYNPAFISQDISKLYPEGIHTATDSDISELIKVWSLRNDRSIWDPLYRHLISSEGDWILQERDTDLAGGSIRAFGAYQPLVIISDSSDRDKGLALGLYRPESEINNFVIAGVNENTGVIEYMDDRILTARILEQPRRTPTMSKYGFYIDARGMLNRNRTSPGIYETLRSEFYILVGTPNEIFEAANKIHEFSYSLPPLPEWEFESDLEGWVLRKSLSGKVAEGILDLSITGGDPYMVSPGNLDVDAAETKYVIISMKNGTGTSSGSIFWTTDTQGTFNASYSTSFNINPQDNDFSRYVIDMSGEANWNGTIRSIRLDPSNAATSGNIEIDYIKISNDLTSLAREIITGIPVSIYPNPAKDYFVIDAGLPSHISIHDSAGRIIQSMKANPGSTKVSTSDWPVGVYIIRVSNKTGSKALRLIVVN